MIRRLNGKIGCRGGWWESGAADDGADGLGMIVVFVFDGHGMELLFGAVDGFPPEIHPPVNETSLVFVVDVVSNQDGPITYTFFTPVRRELQYFPRGIEISYQ